MEKEEKLGRCPFLSRDNALTLPHNAVDGYTFVRFAP